MTADANIKCIFFLYRKHVNFNLIKIIVSHRENILVQKQINNKKISTMYIKLLLLNILCKYLSDVPTSKRNFNFYASVIRKKPFKAKYIYPYISYTSDSSARLVRPFANFDIIIGPVHLSRVSNFTWNLIHHFTDLTDTLIDL